MDTRRNFKIGIGEEELEDWMWGFCNRVWNYRKR